MSVPQATMPEMKDLVPSIGSSTQTYSASVCSEPYSSPRMPCAGKFLRISPRMTSSAARSATVTGSKPRASCSRPSSAVRKNGRMVSPDARGELVDEAGEIDGRHTLLPTHSPNNLRLTEPEGYRRVHPAAGRTLRKLAALCAARKSRAANLQSSLSDAGWRDRLCIFATAICKIAE